MPPVSRSSGVANHRATRPRTSRILRRRAPVQRRPSSSRGSGRTRPTCRVRTGDTLLSPRFRTGPSPIAYPAETIVYPRPRAAGDDGWGFANASQVVEIRANRPASSFASPPAPPPCDRSAAADRDTVRRFFREDGIENVPRRAVRDRRPPALYRRAGLEAKSPRYRRSTSFR